MTGITRASCGLVMATGLLLGTGLAQAALSPAVDGMVYDDVLDLCWLQNASAAGSRNWNDAVAWAEDLEFGGHTDWRLARMSTDSSNVAFTCSAITEQACIDSRNELGYMFSYNLPNNFPKTGNQGPFLNIPPVVWSSTDWSVDWAWGFIFESGSGSGSVSGGGTSFAKKSLQFPGWAVRPGQCRAAPGRPEPIPAVGAWGLGVLGLLMMLLARARLRR